MDLQFWIKKLKFIGTFTPRTHEKLAFKRYLEYVFIVIIIVQEINNDDMMVRKVIVTIITVILHLMSCMNQKSSVI